MKPDDLIREAVKRKRYAIEAERNNREEALDDLQNLAGVGQWPQDIRDSRESTGRPCLTINRLPQFVRQVTGDLRRMNPAINITPGDDKATEEVAEIYEGLIREIQYRCDASSVFEQAAENAAQCGMGYFRVLHDYEHDETFDQEIQIKRIANPFAVYFDPAAKEPTREDAGFCFVDEVMSREDFEEAYPDKQAVSVDGDDETDDLAYWREGNDVVVSEYFWKEPVRYKIGMTRDGQIVRDPVAALDVVQVREVESHRVMWAKITHKDILEGPQEFPCRYIPVIAVIGEEMTIGQETVRTSVIRFAKDPQRLYNYWRSAQTEMVALQPKAPFLVTLKQVAGLETFWKEANDSNRPYLPYNPDEKAPYPQRAMPPVPSQGMMQEVMTAADDMKATTGVYDAALGDRSNETSGVAIRQRQMEADVSTSIYSDNLAKSIALCGRIIVEMIPKIYDAARMLRVIGKDGSQDVVPVNGAMITQDGVQLVNSLRQGRYTVRVSVGPNYTTKRQEAAESMIEFVRAFPQAAPLVGDLIAENMDWPGADQFAERLKKMLPPGMSDEELTPEQQAQAQQAAQMQAQQMQLQQAMQEAEVRKAMADAGEAESDAEKARFEVMEQQLETMAKTGQLDAAIAQLVQQEVARALQSAMQPGFAPNF